MNNFSDFHTINDLKFDIVKLQESLKEVLQIKKYDTANGVKNFAAILICNSMIKLFYSANIIVILLSYNSLAILIFF